MTIQKPVSYNRKCRWCRTIITVPESEMNWKNPNNVICPVCGNTVFFTDSYGGLLDAVEVDYTRRTKE